MYHHLSKHIDKNYPDPYMASRPQVLRCMAVSIRKKALGLLIDFMLCLCVLKSVCVCVCAWRIGNQALANAQSEVVRSQAL